MKMNAKFKKKETMLVKKRQNDEIIIYMTGR